MKGAILILPDGRHLTIKNGKHLVETLKDWMTVTV